MAQQTEVTRMGTERRQTGDEWRQSTEEMRRTAAQERHRNEQLAQQLSRESMQQWQRSIEGLLAFPTAAALSLASSALYIAAFVERGFEIFQQSAEALRSDMQQATREQRREDGRARGDISAEARAGEGRGGEVQA